MQHSYANLAFYSRTVFKLNPKSIGIAIKHTRKTQGLTQIELAGICGVGVRFIGELERGKPSCELGKALVVVDALGLKLRLIEEGA